MIATVDYHHLYYKDYWLAPSKANLNGYTLEISLTGRNHDYDRHHHLFLLLSEKYAQ